MIVVERWRNQQINKYVKNEEKRGEWKVSGIKDGRGEEQEGSRVTRKYGWIIVYVSVLLSVSESESHTIHRVNSDGRHPDLGYPSDTTGGAVVVYLVLKAVDGGYKGVIEVAEGLTWSDSVDVEGIGEELVLSHQWNVWVRVCVCCLCVSECRGGWVWVSGCE